jgi:soluble lytic murein transglycosylase-like protein
MRLYLVIVALAWATLLLCIGPARADEMSTEYVAQALCGHRGPPLVAMIERSATANHIDPVHLTTVIAAESRCRHWKRNPISGARGLGQILPNGSANPRHLPESRLYDPATNIELTAQHLARCLALCGGIGEAIGVYNGSKKCRSTSWSGRVLGMLEAVRVRWLRERTS